MKIGSRFKDIMKDLINNKYVNNFIIYNGENNF